MPIILKSHENFQLFTSETQTKNNVKEAISEKIKRFALKNRSHIFNYNTHTQYNVIFVKREILAPDVSHQTEIVNSSRLGIFFPHDTPKCKQP